MTNKIKSEQQNPSIEYLTQCSEITSYDLNESQANLINEIFNFINLGAKSNFAEGFVADRILDMIHKQPEVAESLDLPTDHQSIKRELVENYYACYQMDQDRKFNSSVKSGFSLNAYIDTPFLVTGNLGIGHEFSVDLHNNKVKNEVVACSDATNGVGAEVGISVSTFNYFGSDESLKNADEFEGSMPLFVIPFSVGFTYIGGQGDDWGYRLSLSFSKGYAPTIKIKTEQTTLATGCKEIYSY